MEKPNADIRVKAPIIETGMVISGMIAERSERRKTKITRTTSSTASAMVA